MDFVQALKTAIENLNQVTFSYDGHSRTVNPHHLGILGNELQIHAFQVHNGSASSKDRGWKNFKVAEIINLKILDQHFVLEQTYHPENSHYTQIFTQINTKNKPF